MADTLENNCPSCGGDDTEQQDLQWLSNEEIEVEMSCQACDAEWYAYFTYTRRVLIDNDNYTCPTGHDKRTYQCGTDCYPCDEAWDKEHGR